MIGNIIDLAEQSYFNVIVHGCNCFHVMGAGLAKQIKERYPAVYAADCIFTKKGDRGKLGKYTWKQVQGPTGWNFVIVNAYTQYNYGRREQYTDYDAVRSVFHIMSKQFATCVIGYPKIGAGLAGGDWNIIQQIINEELQGVKHHLVTLN